MRKKTHQPQVPFIAHAEEYCTQAHAVVVTVEVPSRVAIMIPEKDGLHEVPRAHIEKLDQLFGQIENWFRSPNHWNPDNPLTGTPPKWIHAALDEFCDTKIRVAFSAMDWHLVGRACGALGISPGQWILASAYYEAALSEHAIDLALESAEETGNP